MNENIIPINISIYKSIYDICHTVFCSDICVIITNYLDDTNPFSYKNSYKNIYI